MTYFLKHSPIDSWCKFSCFLGFFSAPQAILGNSGGYKRSTRAGLLDFDKVIAGRYPDSWVCVNGAI